MLRYTFDIPNTPQAQTLLTLINQTNIFYEISQKTVYKEITKIKEPNKNKDSQKPDLIEKYNTKNKEISLEYKKFLDETSEQQKSEWIDGKLVLHSPVFDLHTTINLKLTGLLHSHINRHKLGHLVFEKALINLEFAEQNYEPDAAFFLPDKAKKINDETLLYEAPDFIVEITSKGTARRDRGVKFLNYEKHKVAEYWIITPSKKTIEQYYLINNKYKLLKKYGIKDNIQSKVINDFTIPVKALYDKEIFVIEMDRFLNAKYKKIIKQKDDAIKQKDDTIKQKEDTIKQKDDTIKQKDDTIKQKDDAIKEKDDTIKEKDEKINQLLQKLTKEN